MQDRARPGSSAGRIETEVSRLALGLGGESRAERLRRHLSVREVGGLSGLGRATVSDVESGRPGSLETYVRLADALRLKAEFELVDPRRREPAARRAQDPVHAAMGEAQAARLRGLGFALGLDEPFQHFQFAGRADLVAWSVERAALLHIENRTRFPDIQDSFGSFNAKRQYLGPDLAARTGVPRWYSETHVMVALWSGEVLRALRSHRASFASVCPDSPEAFESWWRGEPPSPGRRSILLLFDPIVGPALRPAALGKPRRAARPAAALS
jgi:transcriptional regulator with XRE-family HTH domain